MTKNKESVINNEKSLCIKCKIDEKSSLLIKCECCGPSGIYHTYCLETPLSGVPKGKWRCKVCLEKELNHRNCSNVFGFNPSKKRYTLQRFGMQANEFKTKYFGKNHTLVDYSECEREFWRLINDEKTELCVEYGADLSAKNVGSGFPTKYRNKSKAEERQFIESDWNLNRIALLEDSALRFIPKNISGMIVPWCYVGMCFSCFCWHIEDHWCYSINYMHMGEPKTWYGIPASSAEAFEELMKKEAGDLFESAPDLLHHMTTMYDPSKLIENNIPVFRADQFPGEFMVTFPRAYHAGLNQGFNFAEAVNMCPSDWFDFGLKSVDSYASVCRPTVFSHSELLCRMASLPDELSADFLIIVIKQLEELLSEERLLRKKAIEYGIRKTERFSFEDCDEERRECEYCKTTLFTSTICCNCSEDERVVCLKHYNHLDCCTGSEQTLLYRYTLDEYSDFIDRLKQRLKVFQDWYTRIEHLQNGRSKISNSLTMKQEPDNEPITEKPFLSIQEIEELYTLGVQKKYPKRILINLKELIDNINNCCHLVQDMITNCNVDFDQDFIVQIFRDNEKFSEKKIKKAKRSMRTSLIASGNKSSNGGRKLSLDELGQFALVFRQLPCDVEEKHKLYQFIESIKKWQATTRKLLVHAENQIGTNDEEDVPNWLATFLLETKKENHTHHENSENNNEKDILDYPQLTSDWKDIFLSIPTTNRLQSLIEFADNVCIDLPELKSIKRIFNSVSWLEKSCKCLKLDLFFHDQEQHQQNDDDAGSIASTMDTGMTESVAGKSDVETDLGPGDESAPPTDNKPKESSTDGSDINEDKLLFNLHKSISSSKKISFQMLLDLQEESLMLASTHCVMSLTFLAGSPAKIIKKEEQNDDDHSSTAVKGEDENSCEAKGLLSRMNHLDLAVMFIRRRIEYIIDLAKLFDEKINEIIKKFDDNKMNLRDIYLLLENISKFPVRLTSSTHLFSVLKSSYRLHKRLETLTWYLSMHLGIEETPFNVTDEYKRELALSLGLDSTSTAFTTPRNNLEPENVLSKVNRSIFLWMSYIDDIKTKANNLPVTFNALGKIDKLVRVIDDCKISLANTFIKNFSNSSLIDVLLPRAQRSFEILMSRDELKNRTMTTCKNANIMTGAGSGPLGSNAYAQSLKDNSKHLVKNLLEFNDVEEYYQSHYMKLCENELNYLKQLRINNNYKSSEVDQNKVVYCICRLSGFQGLMLQCECCKDWFHNRCVAFPTKDLDMALVRFICPRCQRTSRPDVLKVMPILDKMRSEIIDIYLDKTGKSNEETIENDEDKTTGTTKTQEDESKSKASVDEDDENESVNLSEAITHYLSACPEIACVQLLLERIRTFQEKVKRIFTFDLELMTFLKHFETWFNVKFPMNNFLPEESYQERQAQATSSAQMPFERRSLAQKPRLNNFLLSNNSGINRLSMTNDLSSNFAHKPDSLFSIPSPFVNNPTNFPLNRITNNGLLSDIQSSGTLISLSTAAATANASFARKNVRKTPLEARSQIQQRSESQGQYQIADMSSKIGMGYVVRNTESNTQQNFKKSIEPHPPSPMHAVQARPTDMSPQRFKYRLPQETREILDELFFESCLIEISMPMTRWLWQMRIACDQDADYPGASNPLKMKAFEDSIINRANRLILQHWEKQNLPTTCLDGAIGGFKVPASLISSLNSGHPSDEPLLNNKKRNQSQSANATIAHTGLTTTTTTTTTSGGDSTDTDHHIPHRLSKENHPRSSSKASPLSPLPAGNNINKGRNLISGVKRKYSKLSNNRNSLSLKLEKQFNSTPPLESSDLESSVVSESEDDLLMDGFLEKETPTTPLANDNQPKAPASSSERSQRNTKKPDSYKKMANYNSNDYLTEEAPVRSLKRPSLKKSNVGRRRSSIGGRGAANSAQLNGNMRKNSRANSEAAINCQAGRSCQRPKEQLVQWICCDLCQAWYHLICVGITGDIPDGEYLCPTCLNKTNSVQEPVTGGTSVLLQAFDVLMTD